ncbi:DNA polymerase III subunit delta [Novilysobacter avium]|uniref:DNA polymerase III subunit delta n=1 Tax=Novilysobacter avium TaxID=2781023 RepID=A0A7S6ZU78_9GAMM|nr:DNA polymerase III subunit delta [Lysobacter avium]QOW21394.1 DNA polymerase III subunit delta [Lysobacter avium]
MELKPEQLAAQLGSGTLAPAYLIAGAEPLRVLEAADAVRAAARTHGITEREVFDSEGSREPDWDAMAASFGSPGLFSSRRLLELRLPTGKPGRIGGELICRFCADPPADVVLLVTAGEWSRKHAGKWSAAIEGIGKIAIAWPIKPHELPGWVEQRLRSRGVRADADAVQRLVERIDGNLLAAAQEIDKLALLADGGSLDLARMESLVADAARYDVFRLIDAAMNGQSLQVSRMLAGLRAEGEAVPALLGMVVIELQRTAALSRIKARGGNLAAEFKAQRVWDSKQPMYQRALQRHPPARWDAFVSRIGAVDRMAKGREPGDPWLMLERVLLAVADPAAVRLLVHVDA